MFQYGIESSGCEFSCCSFCPLCFFWLAVIVIVGRLICFNSCLVVWSANIQIYSKAKQSQRQSRRLQKRAACELFVGWRTQCEKKGGEASNTKCKKTRDCEEFKLRGRKKGKQSSGGIQNMATVKTR